VELQFDPPSVKSQLIHFRAILNTEPGEHDRLAMEKLASAPTLTSSHMIQVEPHSSGELTETNDMFVLRVQHQEAENFLPVNYLKRHPERYLTLFPQ